MSTAAYIIIALLLLLAIGAQVRYAQTFLRAGVEVGLATKIVWVVNVLLLTGLMGLLGWFMMRGGTR